MKFSAGFLQWQPAGVPLLRVPLSNTRCFSLESRAAGTCFASKTNTRTTFGASQARLYYRRALKLGDSSTAGSEEICVLKKKACPTQKGAGRKSDEQILLRL